jgi:hypothetical protein
VPAVSEILNNALSGATFEGLKATARAHFKPTARLLGVIGQLLVRSKSALSIPEMVILLIVRGMVPVLVRVTFCGELTVPTLCDANDKLACDSVPPGPGSDRTFNEDGKSSDHIKPVLFVAGRNKTKRSAETS